MHKSYAMGADRIWIANVGDLKPMEYPIEFFLNMAWNPEAWPKERIPEYFQHIETTLFTTTKAPAAENLPVLNFQTLYITGGRKDKISKGDIVGLFMKQGGLTNEELGTIEIKLDCSFVAVETSKVSFILETLNNAKLKTKKVRISVVK